MVKIDSSEGRGGGRLTRYSLWYIDVVCQHEMGGVLRHMQLNSWCVVCGMS